MYDDERMNMYDRIIGELEDLVDAETGISIDSLSVLPTLSKLLGHGNPEQAHHALAGIERRASGRDTLAAFAHIGVDRTASSAEERLNAFAVSWAEQCGLDIDDAASSRTVRRWAKNGMRMLATQIFEASGLEPPSLQLDILHRGEGRLVVLISLYWMHGYEMGSPMWIVVGETEHAAGEYVLDDLEEISPQFFQPRSALEFDVGLPTLIRIVWLGETQPTYQVRHIEQPAGLVTMTVMTPGGVGTVVYREGDRIDTLAEIAEALDSEITGPADDDASEH